MKTFLSAMAVTVSLSIIILTAGCETESATENNVRIAPSAARLAKGQAQEFTASGGYEYTWSLENGGIVDEWGQLSEAHGPTTVYTSAKDASTAGTFRIIRVTSTIEGSSGYTGTGSNATATTTSYAMTAEVHVEHAVRYGSLSVSPTTVSGIKYGGAQTFTASGGDGTFSWRIEDRNLGELSTLNGGSTTYSSTYVATDNNTVNHLYLSSGDGQTVVVDIFHANETTTIGSLSITPASTTLTNLQTATFFASGATTPYAFTVSPSGYGTLTQSSATQATFTRNYSPSNTITIIVRVSSPDGQTADAQVNFRN